MSLDRSDRTDILVFWREALQYLFEWERHHIEAGGGVPEDKKGELEKIATMEAKLGRGLRGLRLRGGDGAAMSSYKKRKGIPLTRPQIKEAYPIVLDAVVWAATMAVAREEEASYNAAAFKSLISEAEELERGKWLGGDIPDADDHRRISLMIWVLVENLDPDLYGDGRVRLKPDYYAQLLSALERRASEDKKSED